MSGFDRSKIKATSVGQMKSQEREHETKRPSNSGFDSNYLKIEDGVNKFRIFPFHPEGGGSSYAEAKCVTFLSVNTEKRDDKGKGTGEFEIKRRPVFNAKVHGNYPKDLVEEYMDYAKTVTIPNYVDKDADQFKLIWGKFTNFESGIKPSDTWVVYAVKEEGKDSEGNSIWGKLGLLELKKSIKDQLTELALQLAENEMSPDPYSDVDSGVPIIITKTGKKLDTSYKATLDQITVRDGNKMYTEYAAAPLTDGQLEEWAKVDSLHKKYVNVYKHSDLDMQLEGITRFDEELAKKHKYPLNTLADDAFLDIVEQIFKMVPEDKEENTKGSVQEMEEVKKPVATQRPKTISKPAQSVVTPKRFVGTPVAIVEQNQEEEPIEVNQLEPQAAPVISVSDRMAAFKKKAGIK